MQRGTPLQQLIGNGELQIVLKHYLIEWMVEGSEEDLKLLIANETLIKEVLPHYEHLVDFIRGRGKSLDFERVHQMKKQQASHIWQSKYSLEEAGTIVAGITQTFHSFWQSECQHMKDILTTMDSLETGRVPLSKLYHRAIDTDWRFSESVSYLRTGSVGRNLKPTRSTSYHTKLHPIDFELHCVDTSLLGLLP